MSKNEHRNAANAKPSRALQGFRQIEPERFELPHGSIDVRRKGEGPALLFVHGWPLHGATWRAYVEAFASRYTCIVPDLPGLGTSPWAPQTRNAMTDFGLLMVELVEALGLDRLAIVGHDSGGLMSRVAAAELPDRVAALVLIDTEVPGHVPTLLRQMQRSIKLPGAETILAKAMSSRTYRRSFLGLGGCFADLDHLDGEFHEIFIEPIIADASGAVKVFRSADLDTIHRLSEIHARLRAPSLLVWGEDDPFFPVARGRAMLDEMPDGSAFEALSGAKLLVQEEFPERVIGLAAPFLAKHLAA